MFVYSLVPLGKCEKNLRISIYRCIEATVDIEVRAL